MVAVVQTVPRGGMLGRRRDQRAHLRVMVASGRALDPTNRQEAKTVKATRQGWQDDAWSYRDSIGELRYAERFLTNAARRIRYFPAFYNDPSDTTPTPLDEATECPPDIAAAALDAFDRLGGPDAVSRLVARQTGNFEITGECYVFGYVDEFDMEVWQVKSVNEVDVTSDGEWRVRDTPASTSAAASGDNGWTKIKDIGSDQYIGRMWVPHPRYNALADAPLRAMLDLCEELLITGRSIRSVGRSRLAGAGMLFVPSELDIQVADDDNEDPEAGDFMAKLTAALIAPIADEGVASAVVPILVRGPKDLGAFIKHITFERTIDETQAKQRTELLGRIANGLDLPAEVLLGMGDLNHWTAWQVDDNTFRHHIEPLIVEDVDAWTQAFLWPHVRASLEGVDVSMLRRLCMWYDPTELVTKPDRAADALSLYEQDVLSAAALRAAHGFGDADQPSMEELLVKIFAHIKSVPDPVLIGLFRKYAPGINIEDVGAPAAIDTSSAAKPAAVGAPPPDGGPPAPSGVPGPPPMKQPTPAPPPGVAASGRPDGRRRQTRLARRMVDLDRDLRARLQAAASLAMARALERAGAKLRTRVGKDRALTQTIDGVPAERVAATLGRPVVASLGYDDPDLLGDPWVSLRTAWGSQTAETWSAQLDLAAELADTAISDEERAALTRAFETNSAQAWTMLSDSLSRLATDLLYRPALDASLAELDPSTLVPTGLIRSALAVAGGVGQGMTSAGVDDDGTPIDGEPLGQLATGPLLDSWLSDQGVDRDGYEWVHGPASRPFEPHVALDGVTFTEFDDDALANDDSFPDAAYYLPGDHDGCTCDFVPLWVAPEASNEGE